MQDDVVFRAFGYDPIVTFGSNERWLDAEAEWHKRLGRLCKDGEFTRSSSTGGKSILIIILHHYF